jgi:hypothetical protein
MHETLYRFVHEHQFSRELGMLEKSPRNQTRLLEIVEAACRDRIRNAGFGYSFARIFWKQKLLVWYAANGGDVTLLSVHPDLL